MSARPVDGSSREVRTPFGEDLPRPPAGTPLALVGAAGGVATSVAVMLVYQLVRIGWLLAHEVTRQAGGSATGLESPDRIVGVLLLGGLLSLAPTAVAGGILGGVLGWFLGVTRRHQGLVRSWLSGSLLAYAVATVVNVAVLAHHRSEAMTFAAWRSLLGLPSLLFVLVLGGLGVYLHLRQTRRPGPHIR